VKINHTLPNALPAPRFQGDGRYAPCLTRLRSQYAKLPEAERLVADYLLANSGDAMTRSIVEVARTSTVSPSTVTRLSVRLGYTGYVDMRTALAVEILNPDYQTLTPLTGGDTTEAIIRKVMDFGAQSLYDTASVLDPRAVERAVEAIAGCRRVDCFAQGSITGPIAEMVEYRLLALGFLCAAYNRERQVMSASLLRHGDVALGLSNSGAAGEVSAALAAARAGGATTICITYDPRSPVAQTADICLLTTSRETLVTSDSVASRLPMLAVLNTLYACLVLHTSRAD